MYMIMQAWKVFWNKKVGELCEILAAHTTSIKLRGSRLFHYIAIWTPGNATDTTMPQLKAVIVLHNPCSILLSNIRGNLLIQVLVFILLMSTASNMMHCTNHYSYSGSPKNGDAAVTCFSASLLMAMAYEVADVLGICLTDL